jgi:hypothetical protein
MGLARASVTGENMHLGSRNVDSGMQARATQRLQCLVHACARAHSLTRAKTATLPATLATDHG